VTLLDARERVLKTNRKTWLWIAAASLLLVLGVAITFWSFLQTEEISKARKHVVAVLNRTNALLSELKDAETGQRGYLLSANPAFLEPYLSVRDSIDVHLKELRLLTLVSAARPHLDVLTPLVDAKLAELSQTIALYRQHNTAAALARVNGGEGQRLMDAIRAEIGVKYPFEK